MNSQKFEKACIAVIMILLGAALLDKDARLLSVNKFRYGELLFGIYLVLYVSYKFAMDQGFLQSITVTGRGFCVSFFLFIIWTGISWAVNTIVTDGEIHDLFGITFRLAYYFIVSMFIVNWVKRYGPQIIVYPFCFGVLIMFLINYISTVIDVMTLPDAIPVTNFSGVMLPVCSLYFALLYAYKPNILVVLFMIFSFCLSLLIYSLATYIFVLSSFPVIMIVVYNFLHAKKYSRLIRFSVISSLAVCGLYLIQNFSTEIEILENFVRNKINNISFTQMGEQHEQSGDYRLAHIVSSLRMAMENPFFGVGEANWQIENDRNKEFIKPYVANDNPHNALAQVLSMYGIPAFLCLAYLIYSVFRRLFSLQLLSGWKWTIFVVFTAITFVETANVMDSFFNTYYFYFFGGLVFGLSS